LSSSADGLAVEPLRRQHARARRALVRRLPEHIADQPDDVEPLRPQHVARVGQCHGRMRTPPRIERRALAHEKTRAAPRLEVAHGDEPVVAGHDGGARDRVRLRELADRRHARAAPQQLVVDARGDRTDDLFEQRFARALAQDGHWRRCFDCARKECIAHVAITV
jgi:hypothetical protein